MVLAQCGSFVPAERMRRGAGRPDLYAHRSERQCGAGAVDVHGGDDGDGGDFEYGDVAIA